MRIPDCASYPFGAIWAGVRTAWLLVLGPAAAVLAGLCIGAVAAGGADLFTFLLTLWPTLVWPTLVLAPVLIAFSSWTGLALMLLAVGALLVFWFSEDYRLEALAAIALFTAAAVVHLDADDAEYDWLRVGLGFLTWAALYCLLRFGPMLWVLWRQRAAAKAKNAEDGEG